MKNTSDKPKVAIVGGGAAGMAAAYYLQKKFDVTLFEAAPSLGGHAHAVSLKDSQGNHLTMDTAFLVFNDRTYPNFMNWLSDLAVTENIDAVEMSSCFSDPSADLHYTMGRGFTSLFAQRRNLLRPKFWRLLRDLAAFRKRAYADLRSEKNLEITIKEYLSGYSREFRENFVIPLTAAIWSLDADTMLQFPSRSILQYFDNHQLLRGKSERRWRTFHGSSAVYIKAFSSSFKGTLHLNSPVKSIKRNPESIEIDGKEFDYAVLATHADISLRMLESPTLKEKELLGAWKYQNNPVTLHQDTRLLHPSRKFWASWNMRRENSGKYQISYWLNRVQNLNTNENFILTLGDAPIDGKLILEKFSYRHPVFDRSSIATQKYLPELNGQDRIYYCGSYFGYGFHEDAVRSALAAVNSINSRN